MRDERDELLEDIETEARRRRILYFQGPGDEPAWVTWILAKFDRARDFGVIKYPRP